MLPLYRGRGRPDGSIHPNKNRKRRRFLEREGVSWRWLFKGNQTERDDMKKTLFSIAMAVVAPFAWAQTSTTSTTTTTTTDGGGTITEYTPGSVITLKETSGPRHYKFGKKVVY